LWSFLWEVLLLPYHTVKPFGVPRHSRGFTCQKQGIQILYETPARKFITDDKGKVAGVLADTKDGQLLVNCKACVIAAGGFGRNYEKLKKYREDLEYEAALDEEGAHGNHVKKANTLVELALKMEIDPKTFVDTIERYNKFCETGKDLDFGKPAQMLKPIRKPPFWAIYGHRFSQCTKGANGIAVNPKFEVLNKRGETMPGLWAVGDTSTIYGGRPAGIGGGAEGASVDATPAVIGGASGGAPAAGGPGRASGATPAEGRGGGEPGAAPAASVNILSTEPYPCNGSSSALISGYYAGMHVADYLKN
jgi:hypothetical protein